MITIKNSQLNNDTISALNTLIDLDINAITAFKLMKIVKEVSSLLETKLSLEKKIMEKYLQKDSEGNPIPGRDEYGNVIPDSFLVDNPEKFNQDMLDLMLYENNINHEKIKFEDLGLETAKVKDLIKLDFLFV